MKDMAGALNESNYPDKQALKEKAEAFYVRRDALVKEMKQA